MRRNITPTLAFAVLCAAALLAGGCGPREEDRASDTARTFLTAMDRGDRPAAEQALTEAARAKADGMSSFFSGHEDGKAGGYTLGKPEVTGDGATVPVTLTDADGDKTDARLRMRRENGQWRVYAMTFYLVPGGPQYNLDFEHPESAIPEAFRTLGQGMGMLARGLNEGASAFQQGFEQGMGQAAPTPAPEATPTIEEATPPPSN